MIHRQPDLSERPFYLKVERIIPLPASVLYRAWTEQLDLWFAAPGSVLMKAEVNQVFFFETEHRFENDQIAQRHPHYGRFLRLEKDRLIEMTWVTGKGGTAGAETVLTIELNRQANGTLISLNHAGFQDEGSRDAHRHAWPIVLEQLEKKIKFV